MVVHFSCHSSGTCLPSKIETIRCVCIMLNWHHSFHREQHLFQVSWSKIHLPGLIAKTHIFPLKTDRHSCRQIVFPSVCRCVWEEKQKLPFVRVFHSAFLANVLTLLTACCSFASPPALLLSDVFEHNIPNAAHQGCAINRNVIVIMISAPSDHKNWII